MKIERYITKPFITVIFFYHLLMTKKSYGGGAIDTQSIINKAKKAGCTEIVIKCGKEDIIYHFEGITKSIKIKQLNKVVDSTSAGDSFNGGYLASRLKR
ncbi:carbohydrate kinase family protein [Arcobacter sp. HD9-500m-PIT-SAG02]|nr:carbohydrate kinase family protein [Arcobacter sp. HD9-500m-PIT-SAG02]